MTSSKLDRLWVALFLLGLVIVPIALFLAVVANGNIARYKQNNMILARAALVSALNDLHNDGGTMAFTSKTYDTYDIQSSTKDISIGNRNYHCALITAPGYLYCVQGQLAVTTNHVFIWFNSHGHDKIIPDDSHVSRWQIGY
jgi:hypothetical protein